MMQINSLNEFDFHTGITASKGNVLVIFTAPGCGSCRHWLKLLAELTTPLIQHCFAVDVEIATALAREYAVFHLPGLFLFINGQFHAPIQSEAKTRSLNEAIRAALTQPAHEEP